MKITFMGARNTVFAKNVLGDCILSEHLNDFEISLFDIDELRLEDCYQILTILKNKYGKKKIRIIKSLNAEDALNGADYIVNAIQVGGYEPGTKTDFDLYMDCQTMATH